MRGGPGEPGPPSFEEIMGRLRSRSPGERAAMLAETEMMVAESGSAREVAREQERLELQKYLDAWIEAGLFVHGSIVWEPREGEHWVSVQLVSGFSREWCTEDFRVYSQGIRDAVWILRRGQA